jgi:hypothetical protein
VVSGSTLACPRVRTRRTDVRTAPPTPSVARGPWGAAVRYTCNANLQILQNGGRVHGSASSLLYDQASGSLAVDRVH